MRQAGRYLPEYNKTRAKAGSFMSLCKNPELACEVTLQPIERYGFDAAILFSDILTIPDAMGMELDFVEGYGPKFNNPIGNKNELLCTIQTEIDTKLDYVGSTVTYRFCRKSLDTSLLYFGRRWLQGRFYSGEKMVIHTTRSSNTSFREANRKYYQLSHNANKRRCRCNNVVRFLGRFTLIS